MHTNGDMLSVIRRNPQKTIKKWYYPASHDIKPKRCDLYVAYVCV